MDNIETFNLLAGLILTGLYENFPVPIALKPAGLAKKAGLWSGDGLCPADTMTIAEASIQFLTDEGYIRETTEMEALSIYRKSHVLALQGLRLLSLPDSLQPQESFGSSLLKVAGGGVTQGVKGAIGELTKRALLEGAKVVIQGVMAGTIQGMTR